MEEDITIVRVASLMDTLDIVRVASLMDTLEALARQMEEGITIVREGSLMDTLEALVATRQNHPSRRVAKAVASLARVGMDQDRMAVDIALEVGLDVQDIIRVVARTRDHRTTVTVIREEILFQVQNLHQPPNRPQQQLIDFQRTSLICPQQAAGWFMMSLPQI